MLSLGYLANKNMKKTLLIALLLLVGCGSVDSNAPGPVSGEWRGTVYEQDNLRLVLRISIEENYGIGSVEYLNTVTGESNFYASSAEIIGTTERFSMHLQVGAEWNLPWFYTGRVSNEELCISRDLLPEPERCLAPVTQPRKVLEP